MNTVTEIYLSKLSEVQSRMDECAARAGLTAPRFSGFLSEAAVAQSVPVDAGAATLYDGWIRQAASTNGLDPDLVRAVIQTESGFRADAQSGAGAQGLMQLMPSTAKSLGVTDAFDPRQNIEAGTKYLSDLVQRFGDLRLRRHCRRRQRRAQGRGAGRRGERHVRPAPHGLRADQ